MNTAPPIRHLVVRQRANKGGDLRYVVRDENGDILHGRFHTKAQAQAWIDKHKRNLPPLASKSPPDPSEATKLDELEAYLARIRHTYNLTDVEIEEIRRRRMGMSNG